MGDLMQLCRELFTDEMDNPRSRAYEGKRCIDGYILKPIYFMMCNFNCILINIIKSSDQHGDLVIISSKFA
jgi:hypothetical protein